MFHPKSYLRSFILALLLSAKSVAAQTYDHYYPVMKYTNIGSNTWIYKLGYKNSDGKLVIADDFEEMGSSQYFIDGVAIAQKKYKKGLIDTFGHTLIPFEYNDIQRIQMSPSLFQCKVGGDSIKVIDQTGRIFFEGKGWATVRKSINRVFINYHEGPGEHYSILMDENWKLLAEFRGKTIEEIGPIDLASPVAMKYNKKALMLRKGNTGALVDMQGNILIDSVLGFGYTENEMKLNGKHGAIVVDTDLNQIVPQSLGFTDIQRMNGTGYYYVTKDSLSGIIDKDLKYTVPLQIRRSRLGDWNKYYFETVNEHSNQFTYYNYQGATLITSKKKIYDLGRNNNTATIKKDENLYQLWQGKFIGKTHQFISPVGADGYAYFCDSDRNGILDSTGREILSTHYAFLSLPRDGILAAGTKIPEKNNRKFPCAQSISSIGASGTKHFITQFFYLNLKGKHLSENIYDFVLPYYFGQAHVSKNCKEMLINKDGSDAAGNDVSFYSVADHGLRIVQNKKKQKALMNKVGKILSPWVSNMPTKEGTTSSFIVYEKQYVHSMATSPQMVPDFDKNGYMTFENDNKWGLMDTLGHIVAPAVYEGLRWCGSFYIVSAGTKGHYLQGVLDAKGKLVAEPLYANISYHDELHYFIMSKENGGEPEIYVMKP